MKNFEIITALITPYDFQGRIDYSLLRKNIDNQLKNDIDTFILFGTTGEGSLISLKEKRRIIRKLNRDYNYLIHLYIGISNVDTMQSCKEVRYFSKLNIAGFLVLTPHYIKTNDNGVIAHFSKISEATGLPIFLYVVPKRTGQELSLSSLKVLMQINNIKGIKDANNSEKYLKQCLEYQSSNFDVYSGDDLMLLEALKNQANGIISVCSNGYPKTFKKIVKLFLDGFTDEAEVLFNNYKKYFELMFEEPNPIPIKYLMHKINYSTKFYRLPLYYPSEELKRKLDENFIGDEA